MEDKQHLYFTAVNPTNKLVSKLAPGVNYLKSSLPWLVINRLKVDPLLYFFTHMFKRDPYVSDVHRG